MTMPMMALNQSPVMMFCPLTAVLKQMGLVLFWQALMSGSVPRVIWGGPRKGGWRMLTSVVMHLPDNPDGLPAARRA